MSSPDSFTHESRLAPNMPYLLVPQLAGVAVGKPMHTHPEGQLYIATKGLIVVQTASGRCIMPPGRLGWIPPNMAHGVAIIGSSRPAGADTLVGYTLYVREELCAPLPVVAQVLGQSALIGSLVKRLQRWSSQDAQSNESQRMLRVLMDEVADAPPEPLSLMMPVHPKLAILASAVANDPADETTLDDWALQIGMSRRSITRHFRAETGMSVTQWRQVARLQRAMEMLGEQMSVTRVALELGYDSVSSFISLFRRVIGTTPARYVALGKT